MPRVLDTELSVSYGLAECGTGVEFMQHNMCIFLG